jgi:hypothetical protein
MSIDEYKRRVIALFASRKATPKQWDEMADAVLRASEDECCNTLCIDAAVLPKSKPQSRSEHGGL